MSYENEYMVNEIKGVFIHESDTRCLNEIGTGHSKKKSGKEQLKQTSGHSRKSEQDLDKSKFLNMLDNCAPTELHPGGFW